MRTEKAMSKPTEEPMTVQRAFALWMQEEFVKMGYRSNSVTARKRASGITYVAEGHTQYAAYTRRYFEIHCSSTDIRLFITYASGRMLKHEYEYADPGCFDQLLNDIRVLQGKNLEPKAESELACR